MSLLSVRDLEVQYEVENGYVHAVDGVSFDIETESIVGVLGESGCGKSTLAKSIIGGLPDNAIIPSGEITFDGIDLASMSEERTREIRWEQIAYVPQSAMGSLDPVSTIQQQLTETILAHRSDVSKEHCVERAEEVLDLVGISRSRLKSYPHQLSGGMRQRVLLAMSLLLEPELIIADEPTTGLDVLLRDKILNDIETYRDEFGISVIFVSHDIADLVETSEYIIEMYGGKIIEKGPSTSMFDEPVHPYTIGLKNSLPDLVSSTEEMIAMKMQPPNLQDPPEGCRFIDKCPFAVAECRTAHPDFREERQGIRSACYRAGESDMMRNEATEVDWTNVD
jgi:peptide/nickel transport system ATP-binding protein